MSKALRAVAGVLVPALLAGCAAGPAARDVVYQTSTISALLAGVYDGQTTYAEVVAMTV